MTLTRQIALSQLHQDQHLNKLKLSIDPCCPNCHPVTGDIPIGFRNYWTWLKSVIPVVHQFNSNTLEAKPIVLLTNLEQYSKTLPASLSRRKE